MTESYIKVPLSQYMKWVHQYLLSSHEEAVRKAVKEQARDGLKPWIMGNCPVDEKGNYILEFPDSITVDGETHYRGLMVQRKVSEWADEEKARELIDKYNLWDRCVKYVTVEEIDYDELYAANQDGTIPDEDIDSIIETNVTYALVKVKK